MNKVFVTGATGVFGKKVVKLLIKSGIEVFALSRSDKNEGQILALGGTPKKANLFDVNSLTQAIKGCSAVFHLATSIPRREIPKLKDWKLNDKIRVEGTANLLNAATDCGIFKFIVPSISFLYGNHHGKVVNSNSRLLASSNRFLKAAYQMERAVMKAHGINYIILRYGTFYSEDTFQTLQLIDTVMRQRLPIIGDGEHYKNFIHADDAAQAMVHSYLNFETHKNKVLNITDFEPVLYKDMLKFIARKTHSKPPKRVTGWMARFFMEKELLEYLEFSYRITEEPNIVGWDPKHTFIKFMSTFIENNQQFDSRAVKPTLMY